MNAFILKGFSPIHIRPVPKRWTVFLCPGASLQWKYLLGMCKQEQKDCQSLQNNFTAGLSTGMFHFTEMSDALSKT